MGVLLILSAWIVVGLALCGCGLLAARALRINLEGSVSLSFWVGLSAILGVLCAVCLVHAIDATASILFLAAGATGFVLAHDERRQWWQRLRKESGWLIALLPIAVWMADRARFEPQNGDSYLYHLHAVAWAELYRATPGLGNLHDRLGFNNSSTLFLALLDHGPLANRAIHVANGLLLLPFFGRGVRGLMRLVRAGFRSDRPATPRDALDAVLLAPAVDWVLGHNLSSASPDLPVACLEAAIASELAALSALESRPIAALVLMGTGLLTLKLSALGFLAGLAVSLVILVRRLRRNEQWRSVALACGLVLIAWVVRGVVLSGYPFYPSPAGALPVDWRVPLARAQEEYGYMRGWGRRPGLPWREVLASWDWLRPWARATLRLVRDVDVPVVAGVVLATPAVLPRAGQRASRLSWILFIPPVAALGFWFATSPDPRFAGASFWVLPAAGAALLVARGLRGPALLPLAISVVVLAVLPFNTPYSVFGPRTPELRDPPLPRTRSFVTRSGLSLLTPTSGSGCWGAALLCASRQDEAIRLRDPNNVAAGFTVEPPKHEN